MIRRSLQIVACIAIIWSVTACGVVDDEPITAQQSLVIVHPQEESGAAYLFAANKYLDRVYRVDLNTLAIAEIKVGNEPKSITASPDGELVAVANQGSKTITVIRSSSLVKQTIETGFAPADLRFSPDGNWLAVANLENETVNLIDSHSGEIWEVWVGGGPTSLAFDPTSAYVAVACYYENGIKIVSVAEKSVVYDWTGYSELQRPQVVTFSPTADPRTGTLLVVGLHEDPYIENAESYADSIVVLTLESGWYENSEEYVPDLDVVRAGPNPRGFLWNEAGDTLVAINHTFEDWDSSYNIDTVSMLSVAGGQVEEERRFAVGSDPIAAALSPVEDVVAVANHDDASVSVLDLVDYSSRDFSTAVRPFAVAFTESGHKVVVVHDSALMPLSVIDLRDGSSKVVYESLSMNDWIE